MYISCREFVKNRKFLSYPSVNMKIFFSCLQDVIYNVLKNKSHIVNTNNYIKTLLHVIADTKFIDCPSHKRDLIDFFFDFTCRFFSFSWCKATNKSLSGVSKHFDSEDSIQVEAFNYYNKRKKKKQCNHLQISMTVMNYTKS